MGIINSTLSRFLSWCGKPIPSKVLAKGIYLLIYSFSRERNPKESLVFLLELERLIFFLTGAESCRYGKGIHSKHRHTNYHRFFTSRLRPEERVLDIGCGNGALSYDMALTGAKVVGIDIERQNILFAKTHYGHPDLEFLEGNAVLGLTGQGFDTIVMSNVLEHIEDRIGFLKKIQKNINPKRWLFRVPVYERDWRVPLMEELGIDYRSDSTHFIEYSKHQFVEELQKAGLQIGGMEICWGEIWCEAFQLKNANNFKE